MKRKVYLLSEEDFTLLRTMVDRNPQHGHTGGSSVSLTPQEQKAHETAHSFYNYQICRWIDKMRDT